VGGKRVDDGVATRRMARWFSVSIPLPMFDRQQARDRAH
jgi:hypothetical protein